MPRVYSAQLAAGAVEAGETVVYTVPSNQKAVALFAAFGNPGGVIAGVVLRLAPVGGGSLIVRNLGGIYPGDTADWVGRVVLNAGDSLVLAAEASLTYVVSGYVFLV